MMAFFCNGNPLQICFLNSFWFVLLCNTLNMSKNVAQWILHLLGDAGAHSASYNSIKFYMLDEVDSENGDNISFSGIICLQY